MTVSDRELELVAEIRSLALGMLRFDQLAEEKRQAGLFHRANEYLRQREYAATKRSALLRVLWEYRRG